MKQISKRILKVLLITVFSIATIFLIFKAYFSEEIETSIIKTIEKNLESPLILDNVRLTLYETFPSAAVKITNLLILESKSFNNDTLLFAKHAYIKVNLINIINKKYDLEEIIITDGKINIKYNDLNEGNFLIIKGASNNKNLVSINKITLTNTDLNIKKKTNSLAMSWFIKKSIIKTNNQYYSLNTNGVSKKLMVGTTNYMDSKKFAFIADTKITNDTINIINSDVTIGKVFFNMKGDVFNGNILNLNLHAKEQEINQIITHLPNNMQEFCSPFVANGKINCDITLEGLVDKETNPFFRMNYKINEGKFKLHSNSFELNNIKMYGDVSNGENRGFNSTEITANLFDAKTKNGYINGGFTITNLNNYFLSSNLKSSWDLNEVNNYFTDSPFITLSGKLFATTNYQGNIAFNRTFKKMFLNAKHTSNVKLQSVNFDYKGSALKFNFESANCKLKNNNILINSCETTISETDLSFKGEVKNLIGYIFGYAPKIYIDGDIKSTYTNLHELLSSKDISKEEKNSISKGIMPSSIHTNTTIDIGTLSYEKFIANNVTGNLAYKNKSITANNLNAKSLNGDINGSFTLSEPLSEHLKLIAELEAKKINIRNSFDAFNNYGQTFIMQHQLKGVGSLNLNIESNWGPNFLLDVEKLKIKSDLIIEKGELIDFPPLENLSSYISLEELKHVRFSTLENTIDVKNQLVTIPTMEIKSSALSVFISGTHTFNQKIDYDVTLLLSELLSSSFRKENTQLTEFGEEAKNEEIFNTIYLKMTGDANSPKISLNKIRFMEDVTKGVKEEKEEIINIIKEDILQTQEKEEEEEEGQDIEIEWAPEL